MGVQNISFSTSISDTSNQTLVMEHVVHQFIVEVITNDL
jgi:hypothetical protein